ncbi:MAG TPA: thiamine pyrophosphate-binding protein [Herpetosiphonaceae bacterium]
MAKLTGGELVARTLKAAGVETIFTLCGGHIAAIYDGCVTEGIRIIDTRHEQAAGHAADAWARLTRSIGVAAVTAGPGVTDAVTAVANAFQAGSPLLLLGGAAPTELMGRGALQEMEQVDLLRPITKWSVHVGDAARIPEILTSAIRTALSGRPGPVFVELPFDVLGNTVEESAARIPQNYRSAAETWGDPHAIAQAVELIAGASQPMLIGGSSIYWDGAHGELAALAADLSLPVYLNGMGRGCLPWDHPSFLQLSRGKALRESDLVIIAGTPIDFRLGYGERINPKAKIVQIEIEGALIGRNRGAEVGIVGSSRAVLDQLRLALHHHHLDFAPWLAALREDEGGRQAKLAPFLASDQTPVHHYRFAQALDAWAAANPEAILIGDGGDIVAACARVIRLSRPGQWLDPGPLGCLGVGLPFALAAQALYPERRVVVINGDGSFGLNGFELDTAARFGLPIVSIIGNDAGWGQIRTPQIALFGEERAVATALAPTRYDLMAPMFDGHGEHVTDPAEIGPALERALASGKPSIVNVMLDPQSLLQMAESASYIM